MTAKRLLSELKRLGTAQNRKVYARHGVPGPQFGVSYANLGKLARQAKVDHDAAVELWASGNHDARVLATLIADTERVTAKLVDTWCRDLDCYQLTDAFTTLVARTRHAEVRIDRWTKSRNEWTGRAGWRLLAERTRSDDPDAFFVPYIRRIEDEIDRAPNRVRQSMNTTLIAIGSRSARLAKRAIAAAKRIGAVRIDHGETGCKTPDARQAIAKARAGQSGRAALRRPC